MKTFSQIALGLLAVGQCAAQLGMEQKALPNHPGMLENFVPRGRSILREVPAENVWAIEEHLREPKFGPFNNGQKHALRPVSVIERMLGERHQPGARPQAELLAQIQNMPIFSTRRLSQGPDSDEEPSAEKTQVLEFADGSRLHGALESLDSTKKELVWRGVDASAPITFPLSQISHWGFSTKAKTDVKARATVKFTGGDWLAADVTGLSGEKLQLKLGDGTAMAVDRARVEWIYFSKTAAPECYDGPRNLSGWVSNGGWTYREGALRAAQPSVIGRLFETLPDQVEYQFQFDQGTGLRAFALVLHGPDAVVRGIGPGMVRLMVNDTTLTLWAQRGDNMKQEQVDLSKVLPAPPKAADGSVPKRKPTRWRIFEDRPSGRIVVFIDGRKVADWNIGKGKVGENGGCFSFQPMAWNANAEQSISRIRVMPWDGFVPVDDAIENLRPSVDQVVFADGETKAGRFDGVSGDDVKIGKALFAREKIALLRFARPENAPEEDPPAARVRLAQRGEFDVAGLGFRDGKLRLRTNFGGELALPLRALRGIEFAHLTPVAGKPVDVLLFKNGDQLRGLLESAASGQKLRWRAAPGTPPVEMETARVSGVVIAPRGDRPPVKSGVLARCRNGDFVAGDLGSLDKEHLILQSAAAGRVAIPRERLQALYFSTEGKLPVLNGAWEHEIWEAGLDLNRANIEARKKKAAEGKPGPSLWSYFDGAFAVKRATATRSNAYNNGNFNLGRIVDGLPQRVDFSFDVIGKKNQVFFSAYLFSEPEQSGYMMQIHPAGLFIYDTGGQQRGRGMVQQQQLQFGDKVKADAPQHRIRVLADRPSGRVTIVVDGVVVGNFGPKPGAPPRNLGRGLGLMPQQNMACTFANLWIAPWNGQLPETAPAAAGPPDSVLLANGDEAQGTIGTATPEVLQLESEVGLLDLPVKRLTTVEFAAQATEAASGVRFRLADRSVFTATAYRIENASVVFQTAVAGEVTIPLGAVQEIVFAPPTVNPPVKADEKPGTAVPAGAVFGGGVRLFID